ncbi:MAG TPA: serine hydrolase domain-containing protein [Acidimicrobiales bacterium]|nr:serine hydrolase domain-containing protein [Acidimicrobiales bacterium]
MDERVSAGVESPVVGETVVSGTVAPGFEGVRDAFARNFTEQGEVGAAFSLVHDGRTVVDLWGGVADAATGAPYTEDTLQLVFSTTKGATAICANLLAQRGELDLDAPAAHYWPEFAQAGKGDIPVRWLLCHKSGLAYVDSDLGLEDALAWDPAVEALAAMTPLWEPGTAHGYHAVTYGWLVGEVVRRVTGRSLGTFFADEVAGPLGLEFWIGLPDEQQARVAPLTNRALATAGAPGMEAEAGGADDGGVNDMIATIEQFLGPDSMLAKALGGTASYAFTGEGTFNRHDVRAAELPAANGVTNARSLARMYAATVGTVEGGPAAPLLAPGQVAAATTVQTSGADQVLMFETTFGLGFMTASPFSPYGAPQSFGHSGAGGSVGFADPENALGFGYVMNRMMTNLAGDPRSANLVRAVYEAIGVTPTFA